jgi:Domain of unknown function (DUF4167)
MHIAEKYTSLARDAMASGDNVAAENYLQHAEHYNRIIMAAQAQMSNMPGAEGHNGANGGPRFTPAEPFQRDFDGSDDEEGEDFPPQRPFRERAPAERAPNNYNQHQQPQPYIAQPAFPQTQPQPQPQPEPQDVTPATNGAASQDSEAQGSLLPEGERGTRRRRRRPIGEQAKSYNGRNGSAHPAGAGLNGANGAGAESVSDEAAS